MGLDDVLGHLTDRDMLHLIYTYFHVAILSNYAGS